MKVLISPGHGIGWSTWNRIDFALDPDIIEYFESGADEYQMMEYIRSLGYGYDICMKGYDNCEVVEVPEGSLFKIMQYDGHEWIEIAEKGKKGWMVAI